MFDQEKYLSILLKDISYAIIRSNISIDSKEEIFLFLDKYPSRCLSILFKVYTIDHVIQQIQNICQELK